MSRQSTTRCLSVLTDLIHISHVLFNLDSSLSTRYNRCHAFILHAAHMEDDQWQTRASWKVCSASTGL